MCGLYSFSLSQQLLANSMIIGLFSNYGESLLILQSFLHLLIKMFGDSVIIEKILNYHT